MATPVRLSVLQAVRAALMQANGGNQAEYRQPAHTFLAEKLPDQPELHRQVVLPGAHRAIHTDALDQLHAEGLGEQEIVAGINEAMAEKLAARRAQFQTWRDTELADTLARARERSARRLALQQEKDREIEARLDAELGVQ